MALKLTLAEIENWLRGKAEAAARKGARAELDRVERAVYEEMRKHMRDYKHVKKPPKIKKK
jgi:hypothetical protein